MDDPYRGYELYRDPKTCFIPTCPKSDKKNPGLKFFSVRDDLKKKWCQLVGRNCPKRKLYCCEDHLNPEEDLENYIKWTAGLGRPRLKITATLKNYSKKSEENVLRPRQKIPAKLKNNSKKSEENVGGLPQTLSSDVADVQIIHTVSEQDAQPEPSKILDTRTSLDAGGREQDPPSQVVQQCRFCGEFSKDCVAVSSDMTYLAGNKTTLALNDASVQLDFNDRSRPKTVCRHCDAKLQEFCDFVNVVKAAQGTVNSAAEEKAEFETGAEFEEPAAGFEESITDFEESTAEYEEMEMLVVKTEDSDHNKEGIVDPLAVSENVFVNETHKRKCDTDKAKTKKLKAKEKCDDDFVISIKEEVVEKDTNEQSEVSDTETDIKPTELELARSALVFQMAGDGTSAYQGHRGDR